ncbi:MAG TPA: hypothetical protein VHK69_03740 [Chitinophagaceae bacterium]|jgi:hypothetical protein|nr:hypothetical protein [Chitinophagaceae bacterium]
MNVHPAEARRARIFSWLEIALIVLLALVPLFATFPYRVNIFLSWEGAYRLSEGQMPYRDFGMPLGYMFWAVPALFFKLFGPQLVTLVKAQVFINIVSGLAFRSILKSLDVQPGIRLLSVLLYVLSYSFFNFWPWYNHTVIVYGMVGLAFTLRYISRGTGRLSWAWLVGAALFVFFSFFTKQDGGGLAFVLCAALLLAHSLYEKKWLPLVVFVGSFALITTAFLLPLTRYSFGYWFNHGQPPHVARISAFEIVDEFFYASQWIKFYLFLVVLLLVVSFRSFREFFANKRITLFALLTLGILAEAAIIQITSYTPPDNNIFFHAFAFALVMTLLAEKMAINFFRWKPLAVAGLGMLLWWSGTFWKYFQRIAQRALPATEVASTSGENVVNRKTYMIDIHPTGEVPTSQWVYSGLKSFDKIYMPPATAEGMKRLLNMDLVKAHRAAGDLRVLNMSELTPLAVEMPYKLETGPDIPLWYHLGVAMFNREAKMYEDKIARGHYDLVLFQHIPSLNNFYPFRVREALLQHYQKVDSFTAPRRGDTQGLIEVYLPARARTDSAR